MACEALAGLSNQAIHLKTLPSGLVLLHTNKFSPRQFANRVLDLIDLTQALTLSAQPTQLDSPSGLGPSGLSTLTLANEENLSLGISKQLLLEVEEGGLIVRDEQDDHGLSWHRNYLNLYDWDATPV